jgi:hypothetical protein
MSFITCHLNEFFKEFDNDNKARIKAGQTAVKVEGFRLRMLLKKELAAGTPGGKPFAPSREISKALRVKNKTKPPLYNLSKVVRYNVANKEPYKVEIGFVGDISASYKSIAARNIEGFSHPVTDDVKYQLWLAGQGLRKRKKQEAKYFFLRPSTTQFKNPIRDIIVPFWAAHQSEAMPNIQSNFERKMRGERI